MKKEVILFTAGLDSYILREYLVQHGRDVDCLYFNHSGRYVSNEISKIKKLPFKVILNDSIRLKEIEHPDAFIPNRNILFSVMANSLGYDYIWIGGSKSDRVCDNNENVFIELSQFLTNMNGRHIKIDSPFWNIYKDDMVKWYNDHCNPTDLVYNTFSCFNPNPMREMIFVMDDSKKIPYETEECLKCSACFRKCAVLFNTGIYINFENKDVVRKYYMEFNNTVETTKRSEGTLNYINRWFSEGNSIE